MVVVELALEDQSFQPAEELELEVTFAGVVVVVVVVEADQSAWTMSVDA